MNIEYIRNKVKNELNVKHSFIYNGIRNQIEKFDGVINKCYSGIFTILLTDNKIKSFSYNDIIIGNLEIL